MNCVMKSLIVLNVNELFNPNSFNRVVEDWIHKPLWEPFNLMSTLLWIEPVLPWEYVNAISIMTTLIEDFLARCWKP